MPIIKIDGLPPDYRVEISHDKKRWILVLPDWDGTYLYAEWEHEPNLVECLEGIAKYDNQQVGAGSNKRV